MSPITTVHISSVRSNVSAGFIARVFDGCDIAKVGIVKFYPIFRYGKRCYDLKRAVVNISEWHDSETAYKFIRMLKASNNGSLIYPSKSQYWTVKLYKEPITNNERENERFAKETYEEWVTEIYNEEDDISDISDDDEEAQLGLSYEITALSP